MKVEIAFGNESSESRELVIEPWSDIYAIAARATVHVVIEAVSAPEFEVEVGVTSTTLLVLNPEGAVVSAFDLDRNQL